MNWSRRFPEWLAALREEQRTAGRVPWLTMARAVMSGVVPRRVWRQRIRTCYACPVFNKEMLTCRGVPAQIAHLGCGCYVPFEALSAEPYVGGCWGRASIGDTFGWGAYRMRWWERPWSVVRFVLRR